MAVHARDENKTFSSTCKGQEQDVQQYTHPVQVGLRVLWEVKVDDNIDSLNVNSTGEKICNTRTLVKGERYRKLA
jgi:hypothetical protein